MNRDKLIDIAKVLEDSEHAFNLYGLERESKEAKSALDKLDDIIEALQEPDNSELVERLEGIKDHFLRCLFFDEAAPFVDKSDGNQQGYRDGKHHNDGTAQSNSK